MVRLRQTVRPAPQANWTEHFYSGALKVVGGETETDNQEWINQLLYRGFKVIDNDSKDVTVLGQVSFDKPVDPQGTQVVDKDTDLPEREELHEVEVNESRYNGETNAVNVADSATEDTEEDDDFVDSTYRSDELIDDEDEDDRFIPSEPNTDADDAEEESTLEKLMSTVDVLPKPRSRKKK